MTCNRTSIDSGHERGAGATVEVGYRVRVLAPWGEDEYLVVSPQSADPGRGRISMLSPVGAALLGRRRGEEVRVQTPGGIQRLAILDVVPPPACLLAAAMTRCAP